MIDHIRVQIKPGTAGARHGELSPDGQVERRWSRPCGVTQTSAPCRTSSGTGPPRPRSTWRWSRGPGGSRTGSWRTRSSQIAGALLNTGAGRGSHIGFLGRDSAEFFEVWLGATKAGGAIAPFNWRSSHAELVELVEDARPKVVFVSAELHKTLKEVRRSSGVTFEIVAFSPNGSPGDLGRGRPPIPPDPRIPLAGTETALLTYTSGTTGGPKGVQLSHDAFHYSFLASALEPCLGMQGDDVLLMAMPNFHLTGSWVSLPALYHGATVVILPLFEPGATLAALQSWRATTICLVPAAMQASWTTRGLPPRTSPPCAGSSTLARRSARKRCTAGSASSAAASSSPTAQPRCGSFRCCALSSTTQPGRTP